MPPQRTPLTGTVPQQGQPLMRSWRALDTPQLKRELGTRMMPSKYARTSSCVSDPFSQEINKWGSSMKTGFRDVKFIRSY